MLERLGKFCFSQKRPLLFYIALALPIILGSLYSFIQYNKMKNFEELFSATCKKGKVALKRKQKKERFIKRHTNADPYFLDEYIESFTFSKPEIEELRKILHHPALSDKKPIEARLDFLTKGANRLSFTEEAIRSNGSIKETEEKQRHPVQMNEEDIKNLLAIVEDIPIVSDWKEESRPQIIITDFRIETKQTPLKTNTLEVDMQFLKREFEP
ncbi:MAG TPA: hypothetical protein VLE96_00340 [Chlamydiales bacterium]|nr:hypothetical protein [Chlamydiales bacterium]